MSVERWLDVVFCSESLQILRLFNGRSRAAAESCGVSILRLRALCIGAFGPAPGFALALMVELIVCRGTSG